MRDALTLKGRPALTERPNRAVACCWGEGWRNLMAPPGWGLGGGRKLACRSLSPSAGLK